MTRRHMRGTHDLLWESITRLSCSYTNPAHRLQNSACASCAFTVHITSAEIPVTTVCCCFFVLIKNRLFHGAILHYLNKYCNVLQMYCHVQFYITSLEYLSLRSLIYAEFLCTFETCRCVAVESFVLLILLWKIFSLDCSWSVTSARSDGIWLTARGKGS